MQPPTRRWTLTLLPPGSKKSKPKTAGKMEGFYKSKDTHSSPWPSLDWFVSFSFDSGSVNWVFHVCMTSLKGAQKKLAFFFLFGSKTQPASSFRIYFLDGKILISWNNCPPQPPTMASVKGLRLLSNPFGNELCDWWKCQSPTRRSNKGTKIRQSPKCYRILNLFLMKWSFCVLHLFGFIHKICVWSTNQLKTFWVTVMNLHTLCFWENNFNIAHEKLPSWKGSSSSPIIFQGYTRC